ncbi:hypothetical protein V1264_023949 [Littorina saxatilis]|uniref:Uncharacterized protein n=2 Tax=Littorina saxatilis TaxID=31220 RepID=A0AAN9BAN7_9CAEN
MAKSDLFEAIRKNSLRQMTLLLESGSDVECRNDNSETPLMVALYRLRNKEQREKAVKQLLEAGADVNARNGQGRTPLSFACALDQGDTIRLLLQKKGTDANQGDVSGVTPLMLSAALGQRSSVSTLMEFARSGHVRLNLQAKDDSDFTALDYAAVSGNAGLADQIRGRTKSVPGGAKLNGNKLNNNTRNLNNNNNVSNKAGGGGGGGGPKNKPYKAGEEIEMAEVTPAALRDSNLSSIQQFGRELKALQAQNDTNLTALASSSRPGSRSASNERPRSRSQSNDRTPSRPGSRAAGSRSQERPGSRAQGGVSKDRPGSRVGARSKGSLTTSEDDDDLDLDLSSLRELVGTVREAAKEIREIVEPMQRADREEKEHAARAREHKSRRRQQKKAQGKRRNSGHSQQIQAEVHVISEINGRPIPPLPPTTPLMPSAPYDDDDDDQRRMPPTAFLHVENEELSATWPRQKGRSVSRERSLSGGQAMGVGGASSAGNTPLARHASDPSGSRVPAAAARSENQILEKVMGRQQEGSDPLMALINNANVPKHRLIMESRQRIVGRARDHWSTHNTPPPLQNRPQTPPTPLPHITVSEHAPGAEEAGNVFAEQQRSPPKSPSVAPSSPHPLRQQQPTGPPSPEKPAAHPASSTHPSTRPGRPGARPGPNSGPPAARPAPNTSPSKEPAPRPGLNNGQASRPGPNNGPASRPGPNNGPAAPRPAPNSGSKPALNRPQGGPTKPTGPPGPAVKPAAPPAGPNARGAAQTGPNANPAAGPTPRPAVPAGAGGKQPARPAANGGPAGKAATNGGPVKPGVRRAAP